MIVRSFLPLAALGLCTLGAAAKEARIGPTAVELVTPDGFCELTPNDPSDARLITAVEGMLGGTNRLLAVYADCRQLDDWHAGKRQLLDDMAQYQTLVSLMDTPLPGPPEEAVKQICANVRAEGKKMLKNMTPDIRSRAEEVIKEIQIGEMSFLGVLEEQPLACYAALLQKLTTEFNTEKTQVTVFSMSVIRGKVVYYYLSSPYESFETVMGLLAKEKATMVKLHAANGG